MEPNSPFSLKELCQKYNLEPNRELSQNFLFDKNVIKNIIQAADLKGETVVEVGPGLGTLTKEIVKKSKKVLAVELDHQLGQVLNDLFKGNDKIKIINQDIISWLAKNQSGLSDYKVVASLPYNITSLVIRKFLSEPSKPIEMVLVVQKEVAQRIVARPGEMSLLAVAVQFYSRPKIIGYISPNCFWPVPKVASAIIKLEEIKNYKGIDEKEFFKVARIGFSARRKQLHNNLKAGLEMSDEVLKKILEVSGLDWQARAQDLSIEDWKRLAEEVKSEGKI